MLCEVHERKLLQDATERRSACLKTVSPEARNAVACKQYNSLRSTLDTGFAWKLYHYCTERTCKQTNQLCTSQGLIVGKSAQKSEVG